MNSIPTILPVQPANSQNLSILMENTNGSASPTLDEFLAPEEILAYS